MNAEFAENTEEERGETTTHFNLFLRGEKSIVSAVAKNFYPKDKVIMGDKSPKSVQKQASQKKAKVDTAAMKKKQDLAAKAKVVAKKK